jgi:hypothetical protein
VRIPGLVSATVAVAALGVAAGAPVAGATDIDKYTQTWSQPYAQTTCAQFLTEMTESQRWVMAADILTAARNMKQDTGLPPETLVTEFEQGLESGCVIDTTAMTDAGLTLYLTEPRYQPTPVIFVHRIHPA